MTSSSNHTEGEPPDIRPVVATGSSSNFGIVIAGAVILLGGGLVFNALRTGAEPANQPATSLPIGAASTRITSPPPLVLPETFRNLPPAEPPTNDLPMPPSRFVPPTQVIQQRPVTNESPPVPTPSPAFLPPPRPQVVFEDRGARSATPPVATAGNEEAERVYAGRLANPSTTIPRGTVIPAVLETALDSTRPGGVRALVQRDVFSFDGTRVLIQRGSRLYGEYGDDLQAGQRRAMIQWTRLVRPDGVTIALDSPASDPLGRAGVKGDVDNKFFQRFGGAILQSLLDVGVGIATREATDGVIVALPGSTQNLQVQQPRDIMPTLKVDQGTSVSVFVARELDFSAI